MKRTKAFSSDSDPKILPSNLDEFGLDPDAPIINRSEILGKAGINDSVSSFDHLVSAAQRISTEMYLNQAAICLKSQQEYFRGERLAVNIEPFRILNLCSDMMRELCAYDIGLDPNKAIEILERQGFKVLGGNTELDVEGYGKNTSEDVDDEDTNEASDD